MEIINSINKGLVSFMKIEKVGHVEKNKFIPVNTI